MAAKYPVFDYSLCVCCHMCEQACPVSAIALDVNGIDQWKSLFPGLTRAKCIGCGICVKNCPIDAVIMVDAE